MNASVDHYASGRSSAPDLLLRVTETADDEIVEVWRGGERVRDDRYTPTIYTGDLAPLTEDEAAGLIGSRSVD